MDNDLRSRTGVSTKLIIVSGSFNAAFPYQSSLSHILSFIKKSLNVIRLFKVRFEDGRWVGSREALANSEASGALKFVENLPAQKASGSCYKYRSRHILSVYRDCKARFKGFVSGLGALLTDELPTGGALE
jgi:hypothetical protein